MIEAVARRRAAEEREAARAWFEQNRGRFETGLGYIPGAVLLDSNVKVLL